MMPTIAIYIFIGLVVYFFVYISTDMTGEHLITVNGYAFICGLLWPYFIVYTVIKNLIGGK